MQMVKSDSFSPTKEFLRKLTEPYSIVVIDNFLEDPSQLSSEFMKWNSPHWHEYNNPLETKKACKDTSLFPAYTTSFINEMLSVDVTRQISTLMDMPGLQSDPTLHGAGWHTHSANSSLNLHLDYSIHPSGLQRKVNFLLYLTPDWKKEWGGQLEFWHGTEEKPTHYMGKVLPKYNRAVIFDTSAFAWHGVRKVTCPSNIERKSIALYYMTEPDETANPTRKRAKYHPTPEQAKNKSILELIKRRSK